MSVSFPYLTEGSPFRGYLGGAMRSRIAFVFGRKLGTLVCTAALVGLAATSASAATKTIDLDGQAGNGNESKCDLNVLSSFPVKVENVVTNKAIGNAYDFSWKSAGPGGFTSSAAAGTSGGVGAKWTWTTNESIFSFTGNNCDKDICFLKTSGPDPLASTCSRACLNDGVQLTIGRGASAGQFALNWSGGTTSYTVYRAPGPSAVDAPANTIATTDALQLTDTPPAGSSAFYLVRGSTCNTLKSCTSNADCNPANQGTCVTRGPFAVPGRSLTSTDITVSSASLTSSLITFFSPPKEVFRITSVAAPGGAVEIKENDTQTPMTVVTEAYPPGCCPANPEVPHQLRCGNQCVDYLNDPLNCGACGNVCGEGTCCVNGNCASLCEEGWVWCDGECIDPRNDNANCGACGNACGDGTCCDGGECVSLCSAGQTWCDGACYDLANDNENCGACGNVCGPGTCCNGGACVSVCEPGRTWCNGLCYDLQNDPLNCGACGNVCTGESICTSGACVPCDGQGGRRWACDNRCVNLNTNPYHCGACFASCQLQCPSGFTGVCSSGQSCRCEAGVPPPPPPPNTPGPTNPVCPRPGPDTGPVGGVCPNPNPSFPVPGVCPFPGPPAPVVEEAPVCQIDAGTETIPPGGSTTVCRPGGLLFREVASVVSVCGDGIPGPTGACQDGVSNVASGTFMRLVQDTETVVGDVYLTPNAVHVMSDTSMDGLLQPGESASLVIDVVNAGPGMMTGASATWIATPVDLTDDGVSNPVTMGIVVGTSSYGTILGTQPSPDCGPVVFNPAANSVAFQVNVPVAHPGDTSHPFKLRFTGTVNGGPFTMDVPLVVGIADTCDPAAATRDYDGLDGLRHPMARLVPTGDPVPFPDKSFNAGQTRPLKLRALCGGVNLRGADVDAPEIVGLSEATRGPLDIGSLNLNDDANSNDPFFRWNDSTQQWIYNMRTSQLGTGRFTLTIRIAGRKDYVTGFELR